MSDLPSGTVTFLFTDIEGSTRLLKTVGDRYEDLLAEHDRCLRAAFEAAGGLEVDTQGDAFFAAFSRGTHALAAAVEIQRSLTSRRWPDGAEVRVRIGIHSAEPRVGERRYVGLGVHRASRICAAAHGGQILLSGATRELVVDSLPADLELRDLGEHELKDLERREHLFQVAGPGLPGDFMPLRTADRQPTGEPPFAGREGELARAARASASPRRALRRRSLLLAVLAGALAAAIAVPAFTLLGDSKEAGSSDSRPGLTAAPENSVAVIDPRTNRLVKAIRVGATPGPVTATPDELWVGIIDENTITRIDLRSAQVVRNIGLPFTPTDLLATEDALWIAFNGCDAACRRLANQNPEPSGPATLTRFDPHRNEIVWTRNMGRGGVGRMGIAVTAGAVWVSNESEWTVRRVDTETGEVLATVPVDGPRDIAATAGSVWALDFPKYLVARIDPRSSRIEASIQLPESPNAIGVGPAGIWVSARRGHVLSRIDPTRNLAAQTRDVEPNVDAIAVGEDELWLAHGRLGFVSRVDLGTGQVRKTQLAERYKTVLADIVLARGSVWVTVG